MSGRVQGVFFRDSCRREAAICGVDGWVCNTMDGEVEACFEGAPEAVERMIAWCRRGPSRAVVTSVKVYEEAPRHEAGFRIL